MPRLTMIGHPYKHVRLQAAAACLMITGAALIVYLQVTGFDLAGPDDPVIYDYFRSSLDRHGWFHTLTAPAGNYSYWVPVTFLSHMADIMIWGDATGKYHLNALFYHVLNGLLVFFFFRKMLGTVWTGAFVALLVMVHPLNVATVSYLSCRSVLVSTLFLMLTLIFYVVYVRKPGAGAYSLALLAFVLALLSRPAILLLPFILLVIDYWPLGRFATRSGNPPFSHILKEKIPFFLLAVVCLAANVFYIQMLHRKSEYFKTVVSPYLFPAFQEPMQAGFWGAIPVHRLWEAGISCLGYVWQTFWPVHLSHYLPMPPFDFMWWETAGAWMLLVLVTALTVKYRKQAPYLMAGWLWFLFAISPAVAMNSLVGSFTTHHYAYFPVIGLFIMIAGSGAALPLRHRYKPAVLALAAAVIIGVLATISWQQAAQWKDRFSLYAHGLRLSPENAFLHGNLGKALYESGQLEDAVYHLEQAARIAPDVPSILVNLGMVYFAAGEAGRAEASLRKALVLAPEDIVAGEKLARIYSASGDYEKAVAVYEQLLASRPDCSASISYNLACLYAILNREDTALYWLEKSLAAGFNNVELLKNDRDLDNIRDTAYFQSLIRDGGR